MGGSAGALIAVLLLIGPRPAAAGRASDGLDSLLAGALAVVPLAPADLGLRTDYEDPDPFRIPLVDALLLNPRRTAAVAESLASALTAGDPEIAVAAAALEGRAYRPYEGSGVITLDVFQRLAQEVGGTPPAYDPWRRALEPLASGDQELLLEEGPKLLHMEEDEAALGVDAVAEAESTAEASAERVLAAAARLDRGALLAAAAAWERLAMSAADYWLASPVASAPAIDLPPWDGPPAAEGDVAGAWRLADGRPAVLGGPGPTRYLLPCGLVVDLGGDDAYLAGAGGNGGHPSRIALAIDLAGDDTYEGEGPFSLAAGALGGGILIDLAGDDVYRAGDFGLGAGFAGLGLLDDREGDDRYLGGSFTLGAGAFGIGLLRDSAGRDLYQGSAFTQGFGFVGGAGVLDDRAGEDVYLCQPRFSDLLRDAATTLSMGQGFAYGWRPLASGGIGLLADGGGHDRYLAEVFGQGGAYWCGLGAIVDRAGNDHYDGFNYVQGSGVHVGVGALVDGGGDDIYRAKGVSQGVGHDLALGMLVDAGGNDRYDSTDLSQGAGNANGFGLLVDLGGDDAMSVRDPANSQGYGNPRRHYGSIGVLLNVGGTDRYLGGAAGDAKVWQLDTHGVGVDSDPAAIAALAAENGDGPRISAPALGTPVPVAPGSFEALEPPPAVAPADSIPPRFRTFDFARLFRRAAAGEPRFARERDQARAELLRRGPAAVLPELVARLGTRIARERHGLKDLSLVLAGSSERARAEVERALAAALGSPDERTVRGAAWCLERIEARSAEAELARAAVHPSWRARAAAMAALGSGGGDSSLPAVVAALRDSAGPVRQAAAYALGERAVAARCRFGPAPPGPLADAVAALAIALDDPFYGARHAAAEALGRAGPLATAAAAELALGGGPLARRVLAIHALGAGGDLRAVVVLAAIRDAVPDTTALGLEARVALVRLGQPWEAPAAPAGSAAAPAGSAAALRIAEAAARAGAHSTSSTQHFK